MFRVFIISAVFRRYFFIGQGLFQQVLQPFVFMDHNPKNRAEYEKDMSAVYEILKKGTEAGRETAAKTMDEVRHAMKIDYFS